MEFKTDYTSLPHRRFNPLLKSWLLVSPNRLNRPWKGQQENIISKELTSDLENPLRPNSTRKNGEKNPDYKSIFLFSNDFPALSKNQNINFLSNEDEDDELFKVEEAKGECFVMCYDPRSTVTLASMEIDKVVNVINKWKDLIIEMGAKYDWVQIFENKGEMMGCSNAHPHCQVWSISYVPNIPFIKEKNQKEYYIKHNSPMLYDYMLKEIDKNLRIVLINDFWVCLVPFWAEWPFETMLIPRRLGICRLSDLTVDEIHFLAVIMKQLLYKYNNLFNTEFPYSMGWHGAPTGSYLTQNMAHCTLHASYYPPLLRSATIRKFFVGFELLAESQRDLTAEKSAKLLRDVEEAEEIDFPHFSFL